MFVARGQLHHAGSDAAAQGELRLLIGTAAADRNHGVEQADEAQHRQRRCEVRGTGQAGGLQQLAPACDVPALQLVGDITRCGGTARETEQVQLHPLQRVPPARGQPGECGRQQHLQCALHFRTHPAGTDAERQSDQIIIGIIAGADAFHIDRQRRRGQRIAAAVRVQLMQARDVGQAVVVAAGQPALVGRVVISTQLRRARLWQLRTTARQIVSVVAGAIEEQANPQQADIFVRVLRWCHVHSPSWLRHGSAKAVYWRSVVTLLT